ncbi:hemolysin family protein [Microbacterium limosum]|uniref:Hemolysin family protein n=1 Tax=Microbacterium limosum TaxID=3079935 RepID=A0AAU0MJF1_9MICO|nr:hemolysin family protein [Microbacterium sp. Y20]WOQ70410.1 hemolysin family protein [Microbacterium sp. Y20]
MTDAWIVIVATIALIALSAFFVVIEFALLGARRHRLEELATTKRSARAAIRGSNELTIMLAGAQLGITACTFALGAVTKPAVDAWLLPLFSSWMPAWGADAVAFALALFIVTFLHLVVGEMAPKSWAIAHPERAALLIALPARAFIWVFRPLLLWINNMANRLVAASGIEPVDRAAAGGYDTATLRHLVEHSAAVGALDSSYQASLRGAMELETLTVDDLVPHDVVPTSVAHDATVADVQRAAQESGHLRILLGSPEQGIEGVVHVRDTLLESPDRPARELARAPFVVASGTLVHEALARMRRESQQLAIVMDGSRYVGLVTLADALRNVLPRPTERSGGASAR